MLESIHELPEWEGLKIGILCLSCGSALETVSGEFTIESGASVGPEEIVRCARCHREFDADDHLCEAIGNSQTTAPAQKRCA